MGQSTSGELQLMITVIYRPESTQIPPEVEAKIWRQLKGAFRINKLIRVPGDFDTMEEALATTTGDRAFLEPSGLKSVVDLPQDDIVLVVGNTAEDNVQYAAAKETYRIETEGTIDHNHLYGSDAAAIALAIRYGQ